MLCVIWLSMLTTLLIVRSVLPHPGRTFLSGALFIACAALFFLLARHFHWIRTDTLSLLAAASVKGRATLSLFLTSPYACVIVSCALLLILLVHLGRNVFEINYRWEDLDTST